jgi:hypothetical protein
MPLATPPGRDRSILERVLMLRLLDACVTAVAYARSATMANFSAEQPVKIFGPEARSSPVLRAFRRPSTNAVLEA